MVVLPLLFTISLFTCSDNKHSASNLVYILQKSPHAASYPKTFECKLDTWFSYSLLPIQFLGTVCHIPLSPKGQLLQQWIEVLYPWGNTTCSHSLDKTKNSVRQPLCKADFSNALLLRAELSGHGESSTLPQTQIPFSAPSPPWSPHSSFFRVWERIIPTLDVPRTLSQGEQNSLSHLTQDPLHFCRPSGTQKLWEVAPFPFQLQFVIFLAAIIAFTWAFPTLGWVSQIWQCTTAT